MNFEWHQSLLFFIFFGIPLQLDKLNITIITISSCTGTANINQPELHVGPLNTIPDSLSQVRYVCPDKPNRNVPTTQGQIYYRVLS